MTSANKFFTRFFSFVSFFLGGFFFGGGGGGGGMGGKPEQFILFYDVSREESYCSGPEYKIGLYRITGNVFVALLAASTANTVAIKSN